MNAFRKLINEDNWLLSLPFHVRGIRIDEDALGDSPIRISAQDEEERLLRVRTPYMRGDDIRELQQALVDHGFSLRVDGIFGPGTEKIVKQFQGQKGLRVDGIVGSATRGALNL
ncbi:MAG: hypothetical protein GTO45_10315 [Candidatus Aminicenantes bacterium]|nr:hypothetical protein [Candidatus Aminicenantes bacterium]NIM79203.1 hypothetical protein [Candidatus Aminicenantes bacterium]NIN18481.1 hypothetical protein [Candidatus Aminicenantes bacterium]NIN42377.1 hypothetical protein [Candidatus Aminicenantes bacterium]NIN85143.1 hypothetical protein [Candidatus Aminicenantes bacterium]